MSTEPTKDNGSQEAPSTGPSVEESTATKPEDQVSPTTGMPAVYYVRCRRAQCKNQESEGNLYKKCSRCKLAKYCSQECQLQDWPLHQLMCNPDKAKRMAEDEKNAQAELDGKGARKKHPIVEAAEKAAKQLPDYISQKEMSDPVLIESVMEKIQMHTNPFAVYQYQQLKTRGFLFVQSESELKEFRHTVTQDGMDRCLVCHYMTWDEFTTEVIPGHPNEGFRKVVFLQDLRNKLAQYDPKKEMLTVAVFGCGHISLAASPLAPLKHIIALIQDDPSRFKDQDCLEIYIDRD